MLKGTAASRSDALRHGQRPKVWPSVSNYGLRTPLSDLCAEPWDIGSPPFAAL